MQSGRARGDRGHNAIQNAIRNLDNRACRDLIFTPSIGNESRIFKQTAKERAMKKTILFGLAAIVA